MSNLLDRASILLTPTAYGDNELNCIKPNTSEGDFDFTRVTTATRVNSEGYIESVAANLPRIDYLGGTGHILLEPQSTNKLTESETFSTWENIYVLLTSTNIVAPDGSNSAIKMSSSNLAPREHKIAIDTDTNNATDTIFAKMGEVRFIYNRRKSSTGSWQFVIFDLQEGVVVANNYPSGAAYPKITYYGNGWYRCEVYYNGLNNAQTGWGLSEGNNQAFTPTNTTDGLYIWGAQQEDLSFATSYIPTTSSTVTRSADVAINSGSSDLISSTEGVLYAEFSDLSNNVDTLRFINIGDISNVFHNRISLGFMNDNRILFEVKNNNNTEMVYFDNTTNVLQFNKMCIKYKNNDCSVFINGVKVHEDTNVTIPSNLNTLIMAAYTNGTLALQGKVKSVAVFKEALTDEELTCLTT